MDRSKSRKGIYIFTVDDLRSYWRTKLRRKKSPSESDTMFLLNPSNGVDNKAFLLSPASKGQTVNQL